MRALRRMIGIVTLGGATVLAAPAWGADADVPAAPVAPEVPSSDWVCVAVRIGGVGGFCLDDPLDPVNDAIDAAGAALSTLS